MAWIESHEELGQHPKLLRLARRLSIPRAQAVGHLHYLWWWALRYRDDGDLTGLDGEEIAEAATWEGDAHQFVAAMTEIGWLDREGEGLRIHDWQDYAGRLVEARRKKAEAMRRKRGQASDGTSPERAGNVPSRSDTTPARSVTNRTVPNQDAPSGATPGPAQSSGPASGQETPTWRLEELRKEARESKNPQAVLANYALAQYSSDGSGGRAPPPSFREACGWIGTMMKRYSIRPERLLELMWDAAAQPRDNFLEYIEGVLRDGKSEGHTDPYLAAEQAQETRRARLAAERPPEV